LLRAFGREASDYLPRILLVSYFEETLHQLGTSTRVRISPILGSFLVSLVQCPSPLFLTPAGGGWQNRTARVMLAPVERL